MTSFDGSTVQTVTTVQLEGALQTVRDWLGRFICVVDDADLDPRSPVPSRPGPLGMVGNAVRGALIGMAELVPGVSGGTVALVTGVYPRLLDTGAHIVDGIRSAALGPERRARTSAAFRHVD